MMKIIDEFISEKIEIVNKIDDLDNYEIVNERQICEKYNVKSVPQCTNDDKHETKRYHHLVLHSI